MIFVLVLASTLALLAGGLCVLPETALAEEITNEDISEENAAPAPENGSVAKSERNPFWRDASLSGALYYFQRYRERYNVDDERYHTNLSHATTQVSTEFVSGYLGGIVGLDVGAFASADLYNHGAPDHEMNFFPWRDPWHPDWGAEKADNGASVYKANIKFKAGPAWAKAGYFQPSGPGVLGVNWSFLPGTYQGAEMGADIGNLSLAGAWANEYKAPWFKDTYRLRQNDGETMVNWLYSLGARYNFEKASVEVAYGHSDDYLTNAHLKLRYNTDWDEGKQSLYLTSQTYFMTDSASSGPNDNFDGLALHQFMAAHYNYDLWRFRLEFLYTRAPTNSSDNVGYFAYRLISAYGGANGAYEPWWDSRSDWDHNEEKAVYAGFSRKLDDLLGIKGFSAGMGYSHGWDGKAYGYSQRLNEKALTLDLGYTVPDGRLKGSAVKAHYTEYRNGTSLPSWTGYKNAFQDERDFKLIVSFPFSL